MCVALGKQVQYCRLDEELIEGNPELTPTNQTKQYTDAQPITQYGSTVYIGMAMVSHWLCIYYVHVHCCMYVHVHVMFVGVG